MGIKKVNHSQIHSSDLKKLASRNLNGTIVILNFIPDSSFKTYNIFTALAKMCAYKVERLALQTRLMVHWFCEARN
jgi:hypothetical protein